MPMIRGNNTPGPFPLDITTDRNARGNDFGESPFAAQYLPALLAQASQAISGEFHRIVADNGLSVSEWRVLATLAGGVALSIGRIAQVTTFKQPTVTKVLDRLQARGEVRRESDPHDRRVTLVRITPEGERKVEDLIPQARAHERAVLRRLAPDEADRLKAALRAIVRSYHQRELPEPDAPGHA